MERLKKEFRLLDTGEVVKAWVYLMDYNKCKERRIVYLASTTEINGETVFVWR